MALQSRLTAEFPTLSPPTSRLSRFAECAYKARPVTSRELPKLDASLASACARMGTVLAQEKVVADKSTKGCHVLRTTKIYELYYTHVDDEFISSMTAS